MLLLIVERACMWYFLSSRRACFFGLVYCTLSNVQARPVQRLTWPSSSPLLKLINRPTSVVSSEYLLPGISYSSVHLHYLPIHNSLQSTDMQSLFPSIIMTRYCCRPVLLEIYTFIFDVCNWVIYLFFIYLFVFIRPRRSRAVSNKNKTTNNATAYEEKL